jgi:hypothetical protein
MTATYTNYEELRAVSNNRNRVLYSKASRNQKPDKKDKCRVRITTMITASHHRLLQS